MDTESQHKRYRRICRRLKLPNKIEPNRTYFIDSTRIKSYKAYEWKKLISKKPSRFLKLTVMLDDKNRVRDLRRGYKFLLPSKTLKIESFADRGYDSKRIYDFFERNGIEPILKTKRIKKPFHRLRAGMIYKWFNDKDMKKIYRQRWNIKRLFYLLKINFGDGVKARMFRHRYREFVFKLYFVQNFLLI